MVAMSEPEITTPIWTRVVADPVFRDALILDPLRALAEAADVAVSPEQVRRLEEMDLDERAELIAAIVREVHFRGGQARFGTIGEDGRLGGF
jgi:hypothetical protein